MKFIVTTTINYPTEAIISYAKKTVNDNWKLVIVGDIKTPHQEYKTLEKDYANLVYLDPQSQEKLYPKLSESIGWNSIQRRNIGYVYSYHEGASIMASVDDDNIPYEAWGKNLLVGKEIEYDCYLSQHGFFDPLSVTEHKQVWHRGYPIDLVPERHKVSYAGKRKKKVLVQADLWDGDPDIDAIARLEHKPCVKFSDSIMPFGSTQISPFNTQNTFFDRSTIPYFSVLPNIGRMDDIWGSYILQHYFPDCVVYCKPSVYQDRNVQDIVKNLENEMFGYKHTFNLLKNLEKYDELLPKNSLEFWKIYRDHFIDS